MLTRDKLLDGSLHHMVARIAPSVRLWSEAELARSLEATLALRGEAGSGVWLFAYGSLIWNPTIHFIDRRAARVHGWHRAFCLSTKAGRGTPENPGLVLALDRGGACSGCILRIAESELWTELGVLWKREMLTGSYIPRWVGLRSLDGEPIGRAITFTIDRKRPSYAGALTEEETIRRLATAEGALGSAADYLFHTRDGLRGLGLRDRNVERLALHVAAAQATA